MARVEGEICHRERVPDRDPVDPGAVIWIHEETHECDGSYDERDCRSGSTQGTHVGALEPFNRLNAEIGRHLEYIRDHCAEDGHVKEYTANRNFAEERLAVFNRKRDEESGNRPYDECDMGVLRVLCVRDIHVGKYPARESE